MIKKNLFLLLLFFVNGILFSYWAQDKAQDKQIDSKKQKIFNINVSAEKKITKFEPLETEPQMLGDGTISTKQNYIQEEIPYAIKARVDSIQALKLGVSEVLDTLQRMYLKTGLGVVGVAPLAQIYFNSLRDRKFQYGVWHDFLWNPIWFPAENQGIKNDPLSRSYMNNASKIWFKFLQTDWKIGANLHYNRNDFHYYGFNNEELPLIPSRNELAQYWQKAGFSLYFKTHYKDIQKLNWAWNINYHFFNEKHNNYENYVALNGKAEWFIQKFLLQIETQLDFNAYQPKSWYFQDFNAVYEPILNAKIAGIQKLSSIFYIRPTFYFNADFVELKIGFLIGGDFGLNQFLGFPDLEIRFPVAEKRVVPYLGISGSYYRNSLEERTMLNPFIHAVQEIRNTLIPAHAYLGVSTSISKSIALNISGNYQLITNQAFFLPDPLIGNTYNVAYSTAGYHKFFFGGEFSYQLKPAFSEVEKLKLILSGYYYLYRFKADRIPTWENITPELWYQANFDVSFLAEWRINSKFKTFAKVFFEGIRPALAVDGYNVLGQAEIISKNLPFYADLNLGAEYFFTPRFTAWVQFNNLINQNYQRYAAYPVQGAQFWVGITYKFW